MGAILNVKIRFMFYDYKFAKTDPLKNTNILYLCTFYSFTTLILLTNINLKAINKNNRCFLYVLKSCLYVGRKRRT